jgi:hypothetical protein
VRSGGFEDEVDLLAEAVGGREYGSAVMLHMQAYIVGGQGTWSDRSSMGNYTPARAEEKNHPNMEFDLLALF